MKKAYKIVTTLIVLSVVALTGCKKAEEVVETSAVVIEETVNESQSIAESIEESMSLEIESLAEEGRVVYNAQDDVIETLPESNEITKAVMEKLRKDVADGLVAESEIENTVDMLLPDLRGNERTDFIEELRLLVPATLKEVDANDGYIPMVEVGTNASVKEADLTGAAVAETIASVPATTVAAETQASNTSNTSNGLSAEEQAIANSMGLSGPRPASDYVSAGDGSDAGGAGGSADLSGISIH